MSKNFLKFSYNQIWRSFFSFGFSGSVGFGWSKMSFLNKVWTWVFSKSQSFWYFSSFHLYLVLRYVFHKSGIFSISAFSKTQDDLDFFTAFFILSIRFFITKILGRNYFDLSCQYLSSHFFIFSTT